VTTPSSPVHRRLLLLTLLLVSSGWWWQRIAKESGEWLPRAYDPWAPLDVRQSPNFLTRLRIDRLENDPARCRAALATSDFVFRPLADRVTGAGCGFSGAVMIESAAIEVGTPFALSCRSALALAMWERHELQPAARIHLGAAVARLEHAGSYACRNLYGRESGARSRHATADALDLTGVVLDDGRRVRVLGAWPQLTPESVFLRRIHRGACRYFDAVLGPDYNAAHRDHFHFDRGGFGACR
jgi:hypothetical protein